MGRSTEVHCQRAQCDTDHRRDPVEHYRQLAIEGHAAVQVLNAVAGGMVPGMSLLGMSNAAWRAIARLPIVVQDLVLEGSIFLRFRALATEDLHRARGWEVCFFLNVNDVFHPAADAELLEDDDMANLAKAVEEEPYYGALLWCSRKRNLRPQWSYYCQSLPEKYQKLFNQAPARTDPDGMQPAPPAQKPIRSHVRRIIHTYIRRRN